MYKTNVGDESQLFGGFEQLCLRGEKVYLERGKVYLEIFACGMTQTFDEGRNGDRKSSYNSVGREEAAQEVAIWRGYTGVIVAVWGRRVGVLCRLVSKVG